MVGCGCGCWGGRGGDLAGEPGVILWGIFMRALTRARLGWIMRYCSPGMGGTFVVNSRQWGV